MENTEADSLRVIVKEQSTVIESMTEALTKLRTDTSNFSDEACWCGSTGPTHSLGCVLAKKAFNT